MSNWNEDTLLPEMDDDDIRRWFESRDPNRKKPNPFITQESAEQYGARPQLTQPVSSPDAEVSQGPSFSDHDRHIRETARRFAYMGAAAALAVAIVLVLLL